MTIGMVVVMVVIMGGMLIGVGWALRGRTLALARTSAMPPLR
jgi:hypothetical protein